MFRLSLLTSALLIGLAGVALAQDEPENCSMSAISLILLNDNDNHTGYSTCRAACEADETCVGWNFRPHSFDPDSPGHCQLLGDIYQTEESERSLCGTVDR